MFNRQFIIGHLTKKPSLRFTTEEGIAVCQFRVASNSMRRDKNGDQLTEYNEVIAWDRLAVPCAENLDKGFPVFVEAEPRTREWEDRNGQKRFTLELHAQLVQFLPRGVPKKMVPMLSMAIDAYAQVDGVSDEEVANLRSLLGGKIVRAQGNNDAPPPIDDADAPKPPGGKQPVETEGDADAPKDNEEDAPF